MTRGLQSAVRLLGAANEAWIAAEVLYVCFVVVSVLLENLADVLLFVNCDAHEERYQLFEFLIVETVAVPTHDLNAVVWTG